MCLSLAQFATIAAVLLKLRAVTLRFQPIDDSSHPFVAAAFEIYQEAFPASERHPLERIHDRLRRGLNQLQVGLSGDEVVFMALLWPLSNTSFILLDYMATRTDHRHQGIGAEFMRHFTAALGKSSQHAIIEVENPAFGGNIAQRQARVRFYRRNGARLLQGLRYVLPPLHGDLATEMTLMVFPEYPGGVIPGTLARTLIIKIYQEVYDRDEDDPLLKTFINAVPSSISLV